MADKVIPAQADETSKEKVELTSDATVTSISQKLIEKNSEAYKALAE